MKTSPTYQKGYKAYWDYLKPDSCPYFKSKMLQEMWTAGWYDARAVDNSDDVLDEEFHKMLGIV